MHLCYLLVLVRLEGTRVVHRRGMAACSGIGIGIVIFARFGGGFLGARICP